MDISDIRHEIYLHIEEDALLDLILCFAKNKNELDNIISNEKEIITSALSKDVSFYDTKSTFVCRIGCLGYAKLYHHIQLLPIKYEVCEFGYSL